MSNVSTFPYMLPWGCYFGVVSKKKSTCFFPLLVYTLGTCFAQQKLQEIFLRDFTYSRRNFTSKILHRDWEILCIPDLPGRQQDWLAQVKLTTQLARMNLEMETKDVHRYRYVQESFTWILDDDCHFDEATLGSSKSFKKIKNDLKIFKVFKNLITFKTSLHQNKRPYHLFSII